MGMRYFGVVDNEQVLEITLETTAGMRASVLTFGAALRDLVVPLASSGGRRVILGYENMQGYRANPDYLGVIVGRCCNRIGGPIRLDGREYRLSVNEGEATHLHGGCKGFSRRNWMPIVHDERSVILQLVSDDGEEGYPGRVTVQCFYELLEPATLRITLTAGCEAPTVLNLTSHCYFNLQEGTDCRDHRLTINAESYTPTGLGLIPTGEIRSVAGTPYDFRALRTLRSGGIDYDVNFVLERNGSGLQPAARLEAADGSLSLEVATTQPGLQLYDGSGLHQSAPGIGGQKHAPYAGLAIETQHFPDAPHHPDFPSITLRPGERYQHLIEYRFA